MHRISKAPLSARSRTLAIAWGVETAEHLLGCRPSLEARLVAEAGMTVAEAVELVAWAHAHTRPV